MKKKKMKGGKSLFSLHSWPSSLWPIVDQISSLSKCYKAQAHLSPLLALFSWSIVGLISYLKQCLRRKLTKVLCRLFYWPIVGPNSGFEVQLENPSLFKLIVNQISCLRQCLGPKLTKAFCRLFSWPIVGPKYGFEVQFKILANPKKNDAKN